MSFFGAFFRALAFLAACAASIVIVATIGGNISDMQVASINAETTQTLFIQQQETIRTLAHINGQTTVAAIQGQTSQVWAHEAGDSLRTVALLACAALVAAVIVWQAAKTLRHWLTERRILLLYAAEFLPGADPRSVRVEMVGGRWLLRDYSTRTQWPVETAQAALVQRGLLTVDA